MMSELRAGVKCHGVRDSARVATLSCELAGK